MKALRTLIGLYLNSIFRFPVIRYSKDPRERRNAVTGVAAIGMIVVMYGGMSGWIAFRLLSAGADAAIPFMLSAAMASLFALAMAFAQGSATLSGFADFDTLMGMPVRTATIVFARFAAMYLMEVVYAAAYLLPCGVVYAVLGRPVWWFYPVFPLLVILLPVAPVVIGSGLDLLLSAAFARSKYRKGVTSTIKTVLLVAFVVFAYMLPQLSESFFAAPMQTAQMTAKIYPPIRWFADGVTGSFPMALLFALGSAAVCALFVLLLNRTFLPLHDRLTAGYHVKNYRLGALKRSSALSALFRIEWKRFLNSTAWVVNTIIGAILIVVIGIAGAALSGRLTTLVRTVSLERYVPSVMEGLLIFSATLTPTTACAISMEGKELWIAKTLPVEAKRWLLAKLLVNLLLVGPALLLTTTLLVVFYRGILSPSAILAMYLLPCAALLFTTVFGLFINIRMPRLSWNSDIEIVKQSAPVFLTMLTCFFIVAAAVLPPLLTGRHWLVFPAAAVFTGAALAILWQLMKKAEQIRGKL